MATLLTRRMAALALTRGTVRTLSRRTDLPACRVLTRTEVSGRAFATTSSPSSPSSSTVATRPFSNPAISPAASEVVADAPAAAPSKPIPLSERLPPAFLRKLPKKPAPSVVARRISKLRTYTGKEKNIRHSPWRLNLVCQFAASQPTVPEALEQLRFTQKVKAPLVAKVIKRTANLADIRDKLLPSQLEVAECFATHGTHLKRIKFMGRGRNGKKLRRFSHFRVVIREIDFPLKIAQCPTVHGKRKWLERMKVAEADAAIAAERREETERLEQQVEARKSDEKK